jgi:hypothetical protein
MASVAGCTTEDIDRACGGGYGRAHLVYWMQRGMRNVMKGHTTQYVVCIKNEGYSASLELRKIYYVVPDIQAAEHQMLRVIDESGEDYLCPASYFVPIELPQAVEEAFALAS